MTNQRQKLMIVVERFPPMGGIGSRRWTKFAKYLSNKGYEIHVVTRDYPYEDDLNWSTDLENIPNINIIRLTSSWPAAFMRSDRRFFSRIARGVFKRVGSRFVNSDAFRFYDFSGFWVSKAYPAIRDYVRREKIINIILSGPPHSNFLLAPLLKSEVPGIKVILDYRDPWVFFKNFHVGSISIKKKLQLISDERLCLAASDRVLFVTKPMQTQMSVLYPEASKKCRYIPNVIDSDDYIKPENSFDRKIDSNAVNLVYFGSVGKGENSRAPTLVCLINAVQKFNWTSHVGIKFTLNVYCERDEQSIIRESKSCSNDGIRIEHPVERHLVSQVLEKNHIGIILNGKHDAHAYSSKIFDYVACGLSLFLISPFSSFSNELRDLDQYVSDINEDEIIRSLERIAVGFQTKSIKYPSSLLRDFDLNTVGQKLGRELRELAS